MGGKENTESLLGYRLHCSKEGHGCLSYCTAELRAIVVWFR